MLPAKAGVDAHHQHQINLVDQVVEHLGRSGGVQRNPGLLAQRLDRLHRAVGVRPGLGVKGDQVGSGLGKGGKVRVDRADHQMHVKQLGGVRAQRLHHHRPDGDIGDEMPVHHVDMDPVGTGSVDSAHFLAQPGKIGGQDRGRDQGGHGWRKIPERAGIPAISQPNARKQGAPGAFPHACPKRSAAEQNSLAIHPSCP